VPDAPRISAFGKSRRRPVTHHSEGNCGAAKLTEIGPTSDAACCVLSRVKIPKGDNPSKLNGVTAVRAAGRAA